MKISKSSKKIQKKGKKVTFQNHDDKQNNSQKHVLNNSIKKDSKNLQDRSFHIETIYIKDSDIPKNLYDISEKNIFEAVIFPMLPKDFYSNIFARKALVIKGASSKRFKTIVEQQMFNLDVKKMCKNPNRASDKIHMWFPNREQQKKSQGKEIQSFETEDYKLAVASYERGGASLYFGQSLDFRDPYCKGLTYQMGSNFGSYFTDFSTMGEIETFCSRKGNYTPWHIDFQENFTLQIRGSKVWSFKRSGLEYPTLGYTPHYANTGNIEEQAKVHLAFNRIDINKEYQDINKDTFDVLLEEGDILYHPAGIWHAVECTSNESISINFSVRQIRIADLISNAQRMIMLGMDESRQGVRMDNVQNFFKAGQQLSQKAFDPKYLMPPCIFIPRILNYDLDKSIQKNGKPDYKQQLSKDDQLSLNPFYVINNLSDFPQKPNDAQDAQYVLNGLFGTEDYSSIVRVLLYTKNKKTERLCDELIKWRTDKDPNLYNQKRQVSMLLKINDDIEVIKSLIFNGVLIVN